MIHDADNEATNYSVERMIRTLRRLIDGATAGEAAPGEAFVFSTAYDEGRYLKRLQVTQSPIWDKLQQLQAAASTTS